VLASALPGAETFESFRCAEEEEIFRGEVARRASELGLQRLRWPARFPFESTAAMRAATYAASIGRTVAFAQAAFRQAFAGGHDLENTDYVLIAAAACEMHPAAVRQALGRRSVAERLTRSTEEAAGLGVKDVPAVVVAGELFHGERALEQAGELARELQAAGAGHAHEAAGR
jgi:2-hydroxychromene-2-carboxylate isomerase